MSLVSLGCKGFRIELAMTKLTLSLHAVLLLTVELLQNKCLERSLASFILLLGLCAMQQAWKNGQYSTLESQSSPGALGKCHQ